MKKIVLYTSIFQSCISTYAQLALWGERNNVLPQINEDNFITLRTFASKVLKMKLE